MIDFSEFSSEVFQILRAYGKDIVLYDESGKRVFEPTEARRMYVIGDNILVSIVEDGDNSAVKLFLSPSLNLVQVQGFLETLRRLAVQSNLLFHVKKYNKEIKPKDFATQASVNEQKEISMNIMEGLYGTSKSSYLKMENARMIVRHSARIKEHVIGDRGRHINSIFVENAQGERFLFPVNMLSGARAMTQHVNKGGNFADEVGSQIVRMAQDFRNLAQVTNHINQLPGLQESIKENEKVEAHGVKGMKSTPWRKVFKNLDALNAWCEKNDAEVHAYSAVEQDKTHESAIALRTAIMESMRQTKRSFSRIYTEATYIGECERVASANNLMEDSDSLSESLVAISEILGEGLSDEALLSVARNVTIEAATAPQLDEEVDELAEEDEVEDMEEGDEEMEEGHSIDVTVEGQMTETPNNPQIREFEQWLESFDPDTMFGQKVAEAPAQWEVHGIIGLDSKFCKKFATEDARQEWLDKHEGSGKFEVTELVDPTTAVHEGTDSKKMFYMYDEWEEAAARVAPGVRISHVQNKAYLSLSTPAKRHVLGEFDFDDMDTGEGQGWIDLTAKPTKQGGVSEGKSYKKNDEEDTKSKKEKDQERKDAAKNKKQPVAESSTAGWWVCDSDGTILEGSFGSKQAAIAARDELADEDGDNEGAYQVVYGSVGRNRMVVRMPTPVGEGKSYKKNDDEDAKSKKEKDQERKDAAKNKKQPVEEGKSFKRNDDDETDVKAKRKDDKQKRDEKKTPVEEGKSFKRNEDDADDKKKQDKERKEAAKNKRNVKESIIAEANIQGMDVNWLVMVMMAEFGGKGLDLHGDFYMFAEDDDNQWNDGYAMVEIGTKQKDRATLKTPEEMAQYFRPRINAVASKLGISITGFEISDWHSWQADNHESAMTVKWSGTPLPAGLKVLAKQMDIAGLADYFGMGGMDESIVDEDSSQFSGSFETNINAEDGSVVSAKVTYVPNEAGAATILSVVRGDTGEDVLPFMDDDDILHVEGLCADDIAQQGSERFATEATTIPRNPHQDFKDDVMTGGQDGDEQDPAYIARMKALAGLK